MRRGYNSLRVKPQEVVRKMRLYPTKHWGTYLYSAPGFAFLSRHRYTRWAFRPTDEHRAMKRQIKTCKGGEPIDLLRWYEYRRLGENLLPIGSGLFSVDTLTLIAPLFDRAYALPSGDLYLVGKGHTGLLKGE